MLFIFPKNSLQLLNFSLSVLVKINSGSRTTWKGVYTKGFVKRDLASYRCESCFNSARFLVFVSSDRIDTHRAGSQ